MPNLLSKCAALAAISVVFFNMFYGDVKWYGTFTYIGAVFGVLIYYNIYLYFKEAYKSNSRIVAKEYSRSLAGLSGLYFLAAMANQLAAVYTGRYTRHEVFIIGGVWFFIGGYIAFYVFAFYIRYLFDHSIPKRFTKW